MRKPVISFLVRGSTRTGTQDRVELLSWVQSGAVMGVDWSNVQRQQVEAVLEAHPASSGRCEQAARGVLPVARELSSLARARRLLPKEGWFVVPRISTGARWYEHYSVHVHEHFVDALTGVDGTEQEVYLQSHWKYAEGLEWTEPPWEEP
jgi:hypothetical protein